MNEPTRPVLRWHGGKWMLAPWIISHFPPHRIYVEPFGGAASVLIRKPRSYAEVYNDLDDDVVNLFQVLRSLRARELVEVLRLTPFARTEFDLAYEDTANPVERARRLIVRSFMGFGSDGHNGARPTGFRANSNRSGTTPAHDWANYPDALETIIARLSAVVIEHRPAVEVMAQHDGVGTLHYVDPPYVWETRSAPRNSARKNYRHELSDNDHRELLAFLRGLQGGGDPLRLWQCVVRRRAGGLASRGAARSGRWRARTHRSSLDQRKGMVRPAVPRHAGKASNAR